MINAIQFQKGLSLAQFLAQYGTEAQCEEHLKRLRWPHTYCCPKCHHRCASLFRRHSQLYWQCKHCQYQCSLRAGTLMQHSHLLLSTWFLAIYLVTQSKNNLAALALRRQLGISWHAAWLLKHKLMEAMRQREASSPLQGDVQVDDAYLGGKKHGDPGGRTNKTPFVAAVQMNEGRPQRVRFDVVAGFSLDSMRCWAEQALAPGSHIVSDGLAGFHVFERMGFEHTVYVTSKAQAGEQVQALRWLNVVLSNLKTALSGTHHAFKFAKYAARYLAQAQYRFNRRADLAAMVPRLAVAVMQTKPCPRWRITCPTEGKT